MTRLVSMYLSDSSLYSRVMSEGVNEQSDPQT